MTAHIRRRAESAYRNRAHRTAARSTWRRFLGAMTATLLVAAALTVLPTAPAAPAVAAGAVVEILEQTSASGLAHPGVGLNAEDLRNAREMVDAGVEPWASYYQAMTKSAYASPSWLPSNRSATLDQPAQQYNIQFMRDRAYMDSLGMMAQAIRYVITGEDVYRANALHGLRTWTNLDPSQYQYFADAHIHTGSPLYQMMVAAEIIRYTAPVNDTYQGYSLVWTEDDTAKLKTNLVDPHVATFWNTPNRYLNQHNYGVVGAVAGAIATDNKPLYDERVEWFTVNASFNDVGDWNGSLKSLFREIAADDPNNPTGETYIQHQEIGRDAAHGWGDVVNFTLLARMVHKQGTQLNPTTGTVSAAPDAVDPYHFLDNRLLAGAEYYMRSDSGYDVPWTNQGNVGNFGAVSQDFRGRLLDPTNELYYQYKYAAGVDVETTAPMVAQVYQERGGPEHWYAGGPTGWEQWNSWNSRLWQGAEYWVAFPPELADLDIEVPGLPVSTDTIVTRTGVTLNDGATITQPSTWHGEDGYANLDPADEGAIAIRNMFWTGRGDHNVVGLRVRSTGGTTLSAHRTLDHDAYARVVVPDTRGEWRWITWDAGTAAIPASSVGDNILFLKATGEGGDVQIDRVKPLDYTGMSGRLTPPAFKEASVDTVAVAGEEYSATFTATDSAPSDTLVYSLFGAPAGMTVDSATGRVAWTPGASGSTSFLVVASDGTTLATLPVTVTAVDDREDAIAAVLDRRSDQPYITADATKIANAAAALEDIVDTATSAEFAAALDTLRSVIATAQLLNPLLQDGTLAFPGLVTSPDLTATAIGTLVDSDNQTYWGNLTVKYLTFDFGVGYRYRADGFGILARSTFANRAQGTNVYGSNDGRAWTLLTEHTNAGDDASIEQVDVKPELTDDAFRFLRFQVDEPGRDTDPSYPGVWTLADFRIHGERVEAANALESVRIASTSTGVVKNRVVPGNAVNLTFTTKADISGVAVNIGGQPAETTSVNSGGVWTWQAKSTIATTAEQGADYPFTIDYTLPDGSAADTVAATTDATSLWVSTGDGLINSTLKDRSVLDVNLQPSEVVTAGNGILFDSIIGGNNKTNVAPTNGRAAMVWDFGADNSFTFAGSDVLLQQDNYGTSVIGTLRFEGSNDGQNWTPLTDTFQRTLAWQRFASKDATTSFRYLRVYNNYQIALTELRVFGTVNMTNFTLPDGSVDYRGMVSSPQISQPAVASLADGSPATFWGDVPFDQVVLDFGLSRRVSPTEVGMRARTGFSSRSQGTNVYGSNDGRTWTLLTTQPFSGTDSSVERIAVREEAAGSAYRFLALRADNRTVNQSGTAPGIRNLAEFRIWGDDISTVSSLDTVAITSPNSEVKSRVVPGKSVSLTFTTKDAIDGVAVTIGGQTVPATPATSDGTTTWKASGTVGADAPAGIALPFTIDYRTSGGMQAQTVTGTTNSSALFVSRDTSLVTNDLKSSTMFNGAWQTDRLATDANVVLFDNSIAGGSKTNMPPANGVAAIIWDLGESKRLTLTGADVLIQQDNWGLTHIGTLRLEGSNDKENWTPLTPNVARDLDWQRSESLDKTTGYRYLRLFNQYQISLMELRVFGTVGDPVPPDTTAPTISVATDGDHVAASASDEGGLATVVAKIFDQDGQTLIAELGSAEGNGATQGEWAWPLPADLAYGTYTIRVEVTDLAGNVESATTPYEAPIRDGASAPPAKAALSHNNGWDTGLQDGDYNVTMNLYRGENGSIFRLYENGALVATVPLTYNRVNPQSATVPIAAKTNGTYVYTGELVNSKGTTATAPVTVSVTQASPGTPGLSHDNRDGDGTYNVTADMWWGTNATQYTFYENGVAVTTGLLEAHTPAAQKAVLPVSGKPVGSYAYRIEFTNPAGTTSSATITVKVKK